jgi:hypothetical protein
MQRSGAGTTSLCHVIFFAGCLVDLGPGIDHNREIAVRIKAGCWNRNGSEHLALGGLERRCRDVHGSPRGKFHAGNRRWSNCLALILDDDSQLGRTCHLAIRIDPSIASVGKGDEIGIVHRFFRRDAPSGRKNDPDAAVHCKRQMCGRSIRSCTHEKRCNCRLCIFSIRPMTAFRESTASAGSEGLWRNVAALSTRWPITRRAMTADAFTNQGSLLGMNVR